MTPLVGAHTAMPLGRIKIEEFAKDADKGDREFVMIVNETFREECGEARQMVWFVDTTIEKYPMVVSNWTVPEASGNFCTRGGRFGAHSSNEDMGAPYYQKLTFITFFNAGVRVLDVRNPYQPKEVAYFIPPISRGDGATLRRDRRQAALQQRHDPEQQRRDRRPRLYLCRGPFQHRPAHPGADRRGARDCGPAAELNALGPVSSARPARKRGPRCVASKILDARVRGHER